MCTPRVNHGPVIWCIYKYVLCNSDINIYNHAGDCISFAGSSINVIEDTLNKETVSLMKWFRKKSLAANPAKFQTMLVKNNNINDIELNVTADNVYRPRTHWQYLGIGTPLTKIATWLYMSFIMFNFQIQIRLFDIILQN